MALAIGDQFGELQFGVYGNGGINILVIQSSSNL